MPPLERWCRGRRLSGMITAIFVVVMLFALPLEAQKTTFTVTGSTISFPAPTAADYVAGWINSSSGVTFTVAQNTTLKSRTTIVSILSVANSLGNGKAIGDLQWQRADLATWNSITLTNVQVEQRVLVPGGANDPWSNTINFRLLLNWATDAPATYTASYQITLTQTVP